MQSFLKDCKVGNIRREERRLEPAKTVRLAHS